MSDKIHEVSQDFYCEYPVKYSNVETQEKLSFEEIAQIFEVKIAFVPKIKAEAGL